MALFKQSIQQQDPPDITESCHICRINLLFLYSHFRSLSLPLCLSLFQTKGFEQLRVSWLYASNHSHVYCFRRIRESTSDSLSLQSCHCNNNKNIQFAVVVPLLVASLDHFYLGVLALTMKLSSETKAKNTV